MAMHKTAKNPSSPLKTVNDPNNTLKTQPAPSTKNPDKVDEMVLEINPNIILGIIIVVIAIVIGVFITRNPGQQIVQPATFGESLVDVKSNIEGFAKGDENAPVTIVEYSDYECPYCKMFNTGYDPRTGLTADKSTVERIEETFVNTGKVRYVYKAFTAVPSHNPAFLNEHIASMCAAEQNKFWEYHSQIFERTNTNGLGIDGKGALESSLVALAGELGMNESTFTDCYKKRNTGSLSADDSYIRANIKPEFDKKRFSLGTPFFVVCQTPTDGSKECTGKAFSGAETFENIEAVINLVMPQNNGDTQGTETTE
ncbi:MAG: DsbA family protein [Candidatus Dojkabacteria bacterium]|nr:MAG: DsbA family protein [Candidatus Dojkabacteria bacterium]